MGYQMEEICAKELGKFPLRESGQTGLLSCSGANWSSYLGPWEGISPEVRLAIYLFIYLHISLSPSSKEMDLRMEQSSHTMVFCAWVFFIFFCTDYCGVYRLNLSGFYYIKLQVNSRFFSVIIILQLLPDSYNSIHLNISIDALGLMNGENYHTSSPQIRWKRT